MKSVVEARGGASSSAIGVAPREALPKMDPPASVLVVDDEPAMCEILSLFLGSKAMRVKTALNPCEALDRLSETRFQLIILDWDLAGVEALDLLNFFKATWPETSVIIFTGKEIDEAFLKKALNGRADAILRKLGSLAALWQEVENQLTRPKPQIEDESSVQPCLKGPEDSERR